MFELCDDAPSWQPTRGWFVLHRALLVQQLHCDGCLLVVASWSALGLVGGQTLFAQLDSIGGAFSHHDEISVDVELGL